MPIQKLPDIADVTAHNFVAADAAAVVAKMVEQDAFLSALVGANFSDELMSGPGRTINIKVPAALIARERGIDDKTTGITLDEIKESTVPITLGTMALSGVSLSHGDLDFKISDFTAQVLAPQADSISDFVERAVTSAFAAVPQSNSNTAGSDLFAPAYDANNPVLFFLELRRLLVRRGIPQTNLNVVVGTTIYFDLLRANAVMPVANSGSDDALRNGVVGRIAGFDLVESTRVAETEVIAFHRDAFTLAVRAPSVPAGAPYGASYTNGGYPMSITRAFDIQRQAEIQVVSTYLGVAALPLFRVVRNYTTNTASVVQVANGGVIRINATATRVA